MNRIVPIGATLGSGRTAFLRMSNGPTRQEGDVHCEVDR
jgi:hypothetical protein